MRQYLSLFEFPTQKCNSLIAGISAVVGLIGGVYLLTTNSYISKIVDRKTKKLQKEEISCNVCCAEIDTENPKSFVTCSACEKTICSDAKCSNRLQDSAKWECHACYSSKETLAKTSSWVAEQLSFNQHKFVYPMRARSEIYIPINDQNDSSMHFESVSQIGGSASTTALGAGATTAISNEQKLKIREYVEEIVAQILGGSLDSVAVGQLSKSESYLPAIVNGHHTNNSSVIDRSNDFADLSQTRLRQLIETIIAETLRLPLTLTASSGAVSEVAFDTHGNLGGNALTNGDVRRHRTEHYFEPKIYQDLLATAVLNKIADTHGNAGHLSESSPKLRANDGNQNFQENQSISSSSSLEPRSDCSFTDTDQIINLSKGDDFSPCGSNSNLKADVISKLQLDAGRESALSDYIAAHMVPLPDLSTPATESEEDDYISVTSSQMGDRNWEDNWLFKKKKPSLSATVSTSSIGMLVPAPKEDVRAQIGDKIADEISDLSEMGSDSDDSSLDLLRSQLDPLNNRLLNKHLIGGQNTKMVLDELIDRSSMISATSPTENEPIYIETKNKHVISPTTNKEAINATVTMSVLQSSQPNTDATEHSSSETTILPPPRKFDDTTNREVTLEADAPLPITDQLSSDSNNTDESVKTTVENFAEERATKKQKLSHDEFSSSTSITLAPVQVTNNQCCPKNVDNNIIISSTTTNISKSSYVITNGSIAGEHKSTTCSDKALLYEDEEEEELEHVDDDDLFDSRRFVPGSIAEREYKKWYNAVDMPNNPYAPDALKRRISGSQEKYIDLPKISPSTEQSPISLLETSSAAATSANEELEQNQERDYKRYSRDYYINGAKAQQDVNKKLNKTLSIAPSNSQESVDITINEAEIANKTTTTTPIEHIYKALPAQVIEDPVSLETQSTLSNQSIQSVTTTTSDESDTIRIYNFNKQETTVIRESNITAAAAAVPQISAASTQSTSLESNKVTEVLVNATNKERPTDLAITKVGGSTAAGGVSSGAAVTSPTTPLAHSRGSTPTAFKFLQPKRRLIDPSQVMSFDEDDVPPPTPVERKPIEDEVAHVLPSVKALAQAFLMSSHKSSSTVGTRRWPMKIKKSASEPPKMTTTPLQPKQLAVSPTSVDVGEDATIASDLSSLETDPSLQNAVLESSDPNADPSAAGTSPVPVRSGVLRSNIAFFENLKFK